MKKNEKRLITKQDWEREGDKLFGLNPLDWKFVCPSCGHVASVADWRESGAPEGAIAFSCIGRWTGSKKELGEKPGPCNYAGGGLFGLNPITVFDEDGKEHDVFDFAREGK